MKPSLSKTSPRTSSPLRATVLLLASALFTAGAAFAQDAPDTRSAGPLLHSKKPVPPQPEATDDRPPAAQAVAALPPAPVYDKTIFGDTFPAAQLAFLNSFNGNRTRDLYHDKQFKALKKAVLPRWEFHFGRDMSITEAMDYALDGSNEAVQVRDGRYVMLSGRAEMFPGLGGRGFMWFDMQDGIALAGFYFHPSNGEPTPTTTIFSKQLMVDTLSMAQLPPEFFQDFSQWSSQERVPPITTRYFIGGLEKRLLLEHDEDFCSSTFTALGSDCLQMTADAADVDMNTAYYLDQVHYATNATAYMLVGADQTEFLRLRTNRCGGVADPLGCRILITREQVHRVTHTAPVRVHR